MTCTWDKTTAPLVDWRAVATDATGQFVYAVYNIPGWGGSIFKSTDYGLSFTITSLPTLYWADGMCSKAGDRVVAAVHYGSIFYSTNFGSSWTRASAPSTTWQQIANAAFDANIWVACSGDGVYRSYNGGVNWFSLNAPNGLYDRIASNAKGTQFFAIMRNNGLYTYKTSSPGWSRVYASPSARFVMVIPNTNQAVMSTSAGMFTSSDTGATWIKNGAPDLDFHWLAGDVSGQFLTAVVRGGGLYVSADFGATWVDQCPISAQWVSVASDSAGLHLYANIASSNGALYKTVQSAANATETLCAPYETRGVCPVYACPGQTVVIESVNGTCSGDQYLQLEDLSGATLAFDDDSGDGRCAKLTYTFPSNGTCDYYNLQETCFEDKPCTGTMQITSSCDASCTPYRTLPLGTKDYTCCSNSSVQCNGYEWSSSDVSSCPRECTLGVLGGRTVTCQNGWVDGPSFAVCEGLKTSTCSAFGSCAADSVEDLLRVTQLGTQAVNSTCTYPLAVSTEPEVTVTVSVGGASSDSELSSSLVTVIIVLSVCGGVALFILCFGFFAHRKEEDAAPPAHVYVDVELTKVYPSGSNIGAESLPSVQPSPSRVPSPRVLSPAARAQPSSPSPARSQPSSSSSTTSSKKKDPYEKKDNSEFYEKVAENVGEKVGEHVAEALGDAAADAVGDLVADQMLGMIPFGLGAVAKFAVKSAKNSSKIKGNK